MAIKILVVVSGLALLVPDGNDPHKSLTVLLASEAMHQLAFRQQTGAAGKATRSWPVASQSYEVRLQVDPDKGVMTLAGQEHAVSFSSTAPGSSLRADCLAGSCTAADGGQLIGGRVRFEGNWSTRAVSRCQKAWDIPPAFADKMKIDFRQLLNLDQPSDALPAAPMATGMAFETTVADLEDLVVKVGKDEVVQELELSSPEVCADWTESDDPCVVLEVENWSSMEVSERCRTYPSFDECRLDEHFGLLYELLDAANRPPEGKRWLPYVADYRVTTCDGSGGAGNYPALRCPMGWM